MVETEVKDSIIYSGWYHKVDDYNGSITIKIVK